MSTVGKHYQVILGKMLCPKPLDATYTLEEYYCAGDVHFDGVNGGNLKQMWFSPEEKEKYIVKKSDLLIVEGGAGAGGCAVVSKKAENDRYIQNSILIARHSQNSTVFLKYLIETLVKAGYIDRECNEATFSHFTKEKVCHVPYPVIPILEQQEIAGWLDEKCGEIDAAIGKVDREIELIDELKQSEISRVVTRGLNPDATLRPSGIDWIGDVPEHWHCVKIKHLSPVFRGASPRPIDNPIYFDEDGEFSWVRIADVTASERYLESTTQRLSELGASLSVKRYPGDFFLSIAGTVGKPIITKIKCCIHDGFVWFPLLKINPEFLYYIFMTGQPYKGLGKFGTQLNLNTDTVGNIYIPLPPLQEIAQIVGYLDKKCAEIDGLKEKLVKKRETLKELRQAIISEVVTGKRKVI